MGQLTIHVEPSARELILRRGGSVTVRASPPGGGCCGGRLPPIVVQPGAPLDRPDKYEVLSSGDITVFYDRALTGDAGTEPGEVVLVLSRRRTLWYARLVSRLERKRG